VTQSNFKLAHLPGVSLDLRAFAELVRRELRLTVHDPDDADLANWLVMARVRRGDGDPEVWAGENLDPVAWAEGYITDIVLPWRRFMAT
jgi:hypothetical protein